MGGEVVFGERRGRLCAFGEGGYNSGAMDGWCGRTWGFGQIGWAAMHGCSMFRFLCKTMILVLWTAGGVRADGDDDQTKERMVYDRETGQWVEEVPAEPGTARGDLETVKRMVAGGDKDDGKKAVKAIKKWIKFYGKASELYGEALFAVIVPAPGATLDEDAILAPCRGRIGGYKIPRRMALVAEMPKTATGKILHTELRRA